MPLLYVKVLPPYTGERSSAETVLRNKPNRGEATPTRKLTADAPDGSETYATMSCNGTDGHKCQCDQTAETGLHKAPS